MQGDSDLFRMIVEESQQPLIISEYSFQALDNRSGDRNLIGFDHRFPIRTPGPKPIAC